MITVEQIEALQGRLRILPIQKIYQDADYQKVIDSVHERAKAQIITTQEAMSEVDRKFNEWIDFTSEIRSELILAADWGLQYSLNLLSCLRLANSLSDSKLDELASLSIAELELLKLAIETPKDDSSNRTWHVLKVDQCRFNRSNLNRDANNPEFDYIKHTGRKGYYLIREDWLTVYKK